MPTMNLFFPRRQRVAALRILLHRLNSTVLSGGLAPRFRPPGRTPIWFPRSSVTAIKLNVVGAGLPATDIFNLLY